MRLGLASGRGVWGLGALAMLAACTTLAAGCSSDGGDATPPSDTSGADAGGGGGGGDGGGAPTASGFSVGGTVTGLAGKGLVLQNNGGDDVKVDASGGFSFPSKLKKGGAFKVTVKTQPTNPAQVCTVSGGEGTVVAGDVTTVVVNCAANTFTVGGTVAGLAGAGLVLQNNAGDDAPVNANGAFAFPTPVADGGDYAVTVKTQPSTPTQTCTVTSGSGKVAGANVTTVSVTCTTNKYNIGATVSGLSSPPVVLTNGADEETRTTNGAFTFATQVESGAAYDIKVKTQPVDQLCTVSQGTGTVGGADVNASVTCAALADCSAIKQQSPAAPSGQYTIDPDGAGGLAPFPVYCDMVTDGGGWTIVSSFAGADGEPGLVSDVEANGDALAFAHSNLSRAKKMALSALETESIFVRQDGRWLKADKPMFDNTLDAANSEARFAVKLNGMNGATADGFMGWSNFDIAGGGDFGISVSPDGPTCNGGYL